MELKILYGGLNREVNNKIEELIGKSTKQLVGSNLGKKVTHVALKRYLRDPTVSVVLLSESDYKSMHSSLSDDRLVCVINEDTITNLFEFKYGVVNEEIELENEVEYEDDETEVSSDSDSEEEDKDSLSWEEILANFEKIGKNDEDEEDVSEEQHELNVDEIDEQEHDEVLSPVLEEDDSILELPANSTSETNNNESALKTIISNLRMQIEEQQDFIDSSVSKSDYQELKSSYQQLKSDYEQIKSSLADAESEKLQLTEKNNEVVSERDSLLSDKTQLVEKNNELSAERDSLVNEKSSLTKQISEMKEKFTELLNLYKEQKESLNGVSKSKVLDLKPIKRRYPNIEFLVPLSSNSVLELYNYVSSRKDNFLFIDLSNDSYIDKYIKLDAITTPSKWLSGNQNYKTVIANSSNKPNIRVVTQVVHKMERDTLAGLNWDKVLGDLTTERKVVINIGSIYDSYVSEILKSVQNGVSVVGLMSESSRDQRIGKLALSSLDKYRVLASKTAKDKFGIITDRYSAE